MSFPSLKNQNFGEIPIFTTFLTKFSLLAYISLRIDYFALSHKYDVTSTSYLGCWYLFWYVWKVETLAILLYQLHVSGDFIFKFTRGKVCYKKGLVGRGLTIGSKKQKGVSKCLFNLSDIPLMMIIGKLLL